MQADVGGCLARVLTLGGLEGVELDLRDQGEALQTCASLTYILIDCTVVLNPI